MFPLLLTFRIVIFLLVLLFILFWRMRKKDPGFGRGFQGRQTGFILFWRMRKKGPMSHLTALLLKEISMGIWHRLFGPKRAQIAKRHGKKRPGN